MSSNSKKRSFRERREIREKIPERIPKKHRNRSDALIPEEELLDPVAEARKALEMFEEVSGETNMHVISRKDAAIDGESDQSRDGHRYLNNDVDSERVPTAHRNVNGGVTKTIHQKTKLEDGLNCYARKKGKKGEEGEEGEKTTELRKDEEEKARQKKRIEVGEAKRREFRPKIVGLQESNCLL